MRSLSHSGVGHGRLIECSVSHSNDEIQILLLIASYGTGHVASVWFNGVASTSRFQPTAREEERKPRKNEFQLGAEAEVAQHFCSHFIGNNFVLRPEREGGK